MVNKDGRDGPQKVAASLPPMSHHSLHPGIQLLAWITIALKYQGHIIHEKQPGGAKGTAAGQWPSVLYTQFAKKRPQALSEKTSPVTGHLSEAMEMVLSLKQEPCTRQAVLREAVLCAAAMRAAHRTG